MKTSIAETIRIEKFLTGELDTAETLVFESRSIVNPELRRDVLFQKIVHRLVRLYHRKRTKGEVVRIHNKLFEDPAKARFRESILRHFNS